MIKIESGYYYCVDDQPSQSQQPSQENVVQSNQKPNVPLEIVGNVKGYLQQVAAQISKIKQLKEEQKKKEFTDKLVLDQLMVENNKQQWENNHAQARLEISVPVQIYQLQSRISEIEQKFIPNEVVLQKIQRKGKLSERAKQLTSSIQKLLTLSIQDINNNMTGYLKGLQQKQQQLKPLFLYETFTKTQSLKQQIEMLDVYLNNLSGIINRFRGMPTLKIMVEGHEKILETRQKNRQKIRQLYQFMTTEYQKLVKQIDAL